MNMVLDEIDCGATVFRSRLELFSCKSQHRPLFVLLVRIGRLFRSFLARFFFFVLFCSLTTTTSLGRSTIDRGERIAFCFAR